MKVSHLFEQIWGVGGIPWNRLFSFVSLLGMGHQEAGLHEIGHDRRRFNSMGLYSDRAFCLGILYFEGLLDKTAGASTCSIHLMGGTEHMTWGCGSGVYDWC